MIMWVYCKQYVQKYRDKARGGLRVTVEIHELHGCIHTVVMNEANIRRKINIRLMA